MVSLSTYFDPPAIIPENLRPLTLDRSFSTVSLNIARVANPNEVVEAIRRVRRLRESDLFLFQEVRHEKGKLSVAEAVARTLGFATAFVPAAAEIYDQGLPIVSRYPIGEVQIKTLKLCDLRFRSRNRYRANTSARTALRAPAMSLVAAGFRSVGVFKAALCFNLSPSLFLILSSVSFGTSSYRLAWSTVMAKLNHSKASSCWL